VFAGGGQLELQARRACEFGGQCRSVSVALHRHV